MLNQNLLAGPPPQSLPDLAYTPDIAGRAGETICAGLHGKYFTQCVRGNVYFASNTTAQTVHLQSSGTQAPTIWNPAGSGVNAVFIKIQAGLVAVGVATISIGMGYWTAAGIQPATGADIAGGPTYTAPINAYLGNLNTSAIKYFAAGPGSQNILWLRSIGITQFMATTPGPANTYWQLTEYYDGELILAPGTILWLAGSVGSVATFNETFIWEEVPI